METKRYYLQGVGVGVVLKSNWMFPEFVDRTNARRQQRGSLYRWVETIQTGNMGFQQFLETMTVGLAK